MVRVNELNCSVKTYKLGFVKIIFLLGYLNMFTTMKSLISTLSFLNFRKSLSKNLKENNLNNRKSLVHYRRDLDSLG